MPGPCSIHDPPGTGTSPIGRPIWPQTLGFTRTTTTVRTGWSATEARSTSRAESRRDTRLARQSLSPPTTATVPHQAMAHPEPAHHRSVDPSSNRPLGFRTAARRPSHAAAAGLPHSPTAEVGAADPLPIGCPTTDLGPMRRESDGRCGPTRYDAQPRTNRSGEPASRRGEPSAADVLRPTARTNRTNSSHGLRHHRVRTTSTSWSLCLAATTSAEAEPTATPFP